MFQVHPVKKQVRQEQQLYLKSTPSINNLSAHLVEQNQVMAETENEAHFLPMLFKVKQLPPWAMSHFTGELKTIIPRHLGQLSYQGKQVSSLSQVIPEFVEVSNFIDKKISKG